jgi:prepilin signal peptidase PulO-like enzyme (type II secretory pathway)
MPSYIYLFAIMGLIFGSFVTMASYRIPRHMDLIWQNSFCPHCNIKLSWTQLIPLLSWMIAAGKCRTCGNHISMRYPLTEITLSLVFSVIYFQFGWSILSLLFCLSSVLLMILIIIDFEHYIIPNALLLALLPLAITTSLMQGRMLLDIIISGLGYFMLGFTLRYLFLKLQNKEALGWGDVKFLLIIGLFLNIDSLPIFMLLAGLCGLFIALIWKIFKRGRAFPFGPALSFALFIGIVCPEINQFYIEYINHYVFLN